MDDADDQDCPGGHDWVLTAVDLDRDGAMEQYECTMCDAVVFKPPDGSHRMDASPGSLDAPPSHPN